MPDLPYLDHETRNALVVMGRGLTARHITGEFGVWYTPTGATLPINPLLRLAWMGYVERLPNCWAITPAGKARAAALTATDAAQLSLFD